jgi:hypothetical protein
MPIFRIAALLGSLTALVGCSDKEQKLPPRAYVDIFPGLPASVSNAVLHLVLVTPTNASPTNYSGKVSGNRSLEYPVGSSSAGAGHYDEERLLAIRAEGFLMVFTKLKGIAVETSVVLFRYAEVTETNTLGWTIVGQFK